MRKIEEIFKDRSPSLIGLDEIYHGAVCIPLIKTGISYDILFEVRSKTIKKQPCDVCLPGGKVEEGESPEDAAIRECCEELLIGKDQISIIGPSDIFHRETTIIYPYVVELKDYRGTFSEAEVTQTFTVPIEFFMENDPEIYRVDSKVVPGADFPYERIQGGKNYKWRSRVIEELFYGYNGITIWGLTARVIDSFIKIIR